MIMGTNRGKTDLLIGQLGLFTGRVADPAFELLLDLLKQAIHTVLEEVSVVGRLIVTQVSQGLQSEGFQLLFSVRVATSAHFLRNLGDTQDEKVMVPPAPQQKMKGRSHVLIQVGGPLLLPPTNGGYK